MLAKIDLHLLILFGILCHGIIATVSDEDVRESSDFLVRKRRVINNLPYGRESTRIEDVNYIVKIKQNNRGTCAGVILSHHTVISAARCILLDLSKYKILSGAAGDVGYNVHNLTSTTQSHGNPPNQFHDGITLITVDPPFVFNSKTGYIQLNLGILAANTLVTVFGWGYMHTILPGTERRQRLRSITLPIMNHGECHEVYRGRFNITEKYICTYHARQYCAKNDEGAPLVVNGRLAGIHVWKGEYPNQRNPDVFINIQRPDYSEWIREHILLH